MSPTLTAPKRRPVKAGFAAVLAVAALGAGVFASFTDTESASRSVAAGQLDIMVSPEVLSVAEMAPGDWMSRGLAIDIHSDYNDGNLIEFIDLDLFGSVFDTCADVNAGQPIGPNGDPYECENPEANLLDGNALKMAILSCPDGGQIHDGNPTVDDDDDPTTDSRFDGPGPYTCVVDGDDGPQTVPFRIVEDYYMVRAPEPGDRWSGYNTWLHPWNTGALMVDNQRTITWEWGNPNDPDDWHVEVEPVYTFADGQTLELLTCIQMLDDIWHWDDQWSGPMHDVEDNDYENLSTDMSFNWTAAQRPGLAQVVGDGISPTSASATAESCDESTFEYEDPPEPQPIDPDDYFEGDNTIHGLVWDDRNPFSGGPDDGLYDPNDYTALVGVTMHLHPLDGGLGPEIASTVTDGQGRYRFEDLIDGDYVVTVGEGVGNADIPAITWATPDDRNNDFGKPELFPGGASWEPPFAQVIVTVSGGNVYQRDAGLNNQIA